MKNNQLFKISFLFILFFMFILKPQAECSATELNRLNKMANNVVTDIELNVVRGVEQETEYAETYPSYFISFYNMYSDMYLAQVGTDWRTTADEQVNGTITFIYRDLNYKQEQFNIIANSSTCSGTVLRTVDVVIPDYNEFSNNPICSELPDFMYCKPMIYANVDFTYKDFVDYSSEYKESITQKKNATEESNPIIDFLLKYWIFFIIGIAVIVITLLIVKKIKRNNEINKRGIV